MTRLARLVDAVRREIRLSSMWMPGSLDWSIGVLVLFILAMEALQ